MANLKDTAKDYVQTATTKNITDLGEVSVDVELHDDSFEFEKDGETKTVNQKVIIEGEDKYRVPTSVIQQLKAQLAENTNLKKFKVSSTGSGMDTRYTVIPLL